MRRAPYEYSRPRAPRPNTALLKTALSIGSAMMSACAASPPPCSCPCAVQSYAGRTLGQGGTAAPARTEQELLASYEGRAAAEVLHGKATYYANSLAGNKTASGERYNPQSFTAAHRTLPFGTVVRVVREDTNRYVYVRITDRGPFAGRERIIDLSYVAAERLGMVRAGVVPVRVEVLQ